jgi:protein-S-isoprenylcysteine O-methyltransferase Ste14
MTKAVRELTACRTRERQPVHIVLTKSTFWGWFQVASYACFVFLFLGQSARVLVRSRLNPITLGARSKGAQGLMEILLFAVVNLWGLLVVLHALPLVPPPLPWLFRWRLVLPGSFAGVGAGVVVVAFVLFVLSLRTLNSSWRLGIDTQHPGKLVTWGIYARTRNPIYVFFDLYFFGILLMTGQLAFALLLLVVAAVLHRQILREEAFLLAAHGAEYAAYCRQTGRYLRLR